MKKKLALAVLASLALTTGVAFADPLETTFDGNFTIQYRNDNKPAAEYKGFKETLMLNTTTKLGDNVDFYTRLSYQFLGNTLKDHAQDYIGTSDTGYNGAIDAFGFNVKLGDWKWKLGSQVITIGQQGLVYDNDGLIGKHILPYALTGAGKLGQVNTNVFYARTNYQDGIGDQDKFYGVAFNADTSAASNVGAFYTRWQPAADWGISDKNLYGIDYSYKFSDKVSFAGEYAKTNANTDNKAYIAGLTYASNPADKFGAKYYRSEGQSQIYDKNWGGMGTTPNPDTKGYILSYTHTLDKHSTISASYDHEQTITGGYGITDRNRTRVTYSVNF